MRYIEQQPPPALRGWVSKLWHLSDTPGHARERILPSGTFELVINLAHDELQVFDAVTDQKGRRYRGALVSGAYDRHFVIDTRSHADVIGVHFQPGGARPFLGVPADRLSSAHVELETLWGAAAGSVRARLCATTDVAQRFRLLQSELCARLTRAPQRHQGLPHALERLERGASIAELARELSLSHRRLIEVFAREVGMTPKVYARVRRFQRALRASADPSWARRAVAEGFFDQSHLIRDCLAFSGMTPGDLLASRQVPVKEHHVAVSEAGQIRPIQMLGPMRRPHQER